MTEDEKKPVQSHPGQGATRTPLELSIPISLGELLDKISILEIKSERITQPERLLNVHYELAMLTAARDGALGPLSSEIASLAGQLKAVNERIWDAEEVVHGEDHATISDAVFLHQARIAFEQNDSRARLKRKINDLTGSAVVEEKSYPNFGGIR